MLNSAITHKSVYFLSPHKISQTFDWGGLNLSYVKVRALWPLFFLNIHIHSIIFNMNKLFI